MKTTIMAATVLLAGAMLAGSPMRGGMLGVSAASADSLRNVQDAYVAAMRAGDAKGVAAVFRDDATEMPPGIAPVRGRAAIEAYYRGLFGTCRFTTFELTETDSRIAGDVGYLVGTSRIAVSAAAAGGPPDHEESGKYVVVLKRTGNEWKVAYAIYNGDAPPPPLAPAR
jgi:uncharacterized protein (TIGR02246 family)